MKLSRLLPLIEGTPAYRQLVVALKQKSVAMTIVNTAKPYVIAALHKSLQLPMLVVTAKPENARRFHEQLLAWCDSKYIKLFPELDMLYYDHIASNNSAEMERIQVLSALSGIYRNDNMYLTITSTPAFMQKIIPHHEFMASYHTVKLGMEVEPLNLLIQWQAMGYRLEEMVEIPGEISHRGGILDIYPPNNELPARLEFFGNTIDSIRLFDPTNQRSSGTKSLIAIGPATEMLTPQSSNWETGRIINNIDLSNCNAEAHQRFRKGIDMLLDGSQSVNNRFYASLFNQDSILSYMPSDTLLVLDEPLSIERNMGDLVVQAEELREEKIERGELPNNFPRPYFTWNELEPKIKQLRNLKLDSLCNLDNGELHRLEFSPAASYAGQLSEFIKKTKQLLRRKNRIIIISHQADRLSELFEEEDIIAPTLAEIKQPPPANSLALVQGLLDGGWIMGGDIHLFTDLEIFGFIKQQRLTRKRPVPHHKLYVDIVPDSLVVHIEHGIACFVGITTLTTDNIEKEYLVLQYAAGDKLYVPTDQIDRVSRYVGSGERKPVLSRLGTQEWTRTKQRIKESVVEVARGLLTLYASREVIPGFAFSPDNIWQQELEASFPYVETPDQIEVQRQVKEDMAKAKPMDRLVCGDVGYGKTEVAIRAAFKAVLDGKQVAVLVPTTVLAQQHLATFRQRFDAFPLKVEALSRFRTYKEQLAILAGLTEGSVDICIGTHRLLQEDVVFKNLGLLIIDEEQRFGVTYKEHLKKLRQEADVLTLSATPIPRTLHMSLVGVRDMSVMETPPEERLPIKTYIARYDDYLVKEAILREMERGGQIFFVHNRVGNIDSVANKIRSLVREAKVTVAHGQMAEDRLEAVMAGFTSGESDVLVCTTIIESGLDMPNVNTIIVNKADKFGLTQLYQLRGRVGRGANLAYAYFLYDKDEHLSDVAEKRLGTIFEATELGSGFGIAVKDMEIRGAGNLLGLKQSGHIGAIGFNLYCRLLAEAVEQQRAKRDGVPHEKISSPHMQSPMIELPLSAFIPEGYVADLNTRLSLYQELVKVHKVEQTKILAQEFTDRFGRIPKEVENLLYIVKIKTLAEKGGIESISTEQVNIIIRRFQGMYFKKQQFEPLVKEGIKIGLNQIRLDYKRLGDKWRVALEDVLQKMVIRYD